MNELSALNYCFSKLSDHDKEIFTTLKIPKKTNQKSIISKENVGIIVFSLVLFPYGMYQFLKLEKINELLIYMISILIELGLLFALYKYRFDKKSYQLTRWSEFLLLQSDNFEELLQKFKFLSEEETSNLVVYSAKQYIEYTSKFLVAEVEIKNETITNLTTEEQNND